MLLKMRSYLLLISILSTINGIPLSHSDSGQNENIKQVVDSAAGFYVDPNQNPALNRTVIITGANFGYLNHLHNFKCFMDRLSLKVLVIAMDRRLHQHIEGKLGRKSAQDAISTGKPLSQFYSLFWEGKKVIREESTTFRSEQFNMITHRKTEATIAIMELGYDVVFVDIDIALVRDPIPYLLWNNVDYVHSHNRICPQ
jgi:Nucleotide-diphospho-sugar transferase